MTSDSQRAFNSLSERSGTWKKQGWKIGSIEYGYDTSFRWSTECEGIYVS